jgi:predicted  nucleic acid-binding Zn ribbon protein
MSNDLIGFLAVSIVIVAVIAWRTDWAMVAELRKAGRKARLEAKRIKLRLKQDKLQEMKRKLQNELEELTGKK